MPKSVTFKITSGFGNQLFQLANALETAQKKGVELILDASSYKRSTDRDFLLDDIIQNIEYKIKVKRNSAYSLVISEEEEYVYSERKYFANRFITYSGYFQNPEYFPNALDVILNALSKNMVIRNKSCECGLKHLNMHVRRGDYIGNYTILNKIGALTDSYFENICREMSSEYHATLFSDSPEMLHELKAKLNFRKIDIDIAIVPPLQTLISMSESDVLILSNSTLGWWSAKLGHRLNPKQQVHAPSVWNKSQLESKALNHMNWTLHEPSWF
jgi:hypothetical protein